MQRELKPGKLLNDEGTLNEAGYATRPIKTFNPETIKKSKLKLKQWDYYYVENESYGIAFTVADNGYMGLLSVSLVDFKGESVHTKTRIPLMTMGRLGLPKSSEDGDLHVRKGPFDIRFSHTGKSRDIDVFVDKFLDNRTFNAQLSLIDEPRDSMVIATPFEQSEKMFYYNRKTIGFKVSGHASLGNQKMVFTEDSSWGLLDWGRGVWPRDTTWYWAAFCGQSQGMEIALNLGYGFGDLSQSTENMVFINGKAHKLTDVDFNIPTDDKHGERQLDEPWHITSSDNRIEGTFTPEIKRVDHTDLKVLKSFQRQIFGTFNGTVVLDDGTRLEVGPLRGFAEVVKNKW